MRGEEKFSRVLPLNAVAVEMKQLLGQGTKWGGGRLRKMGMRGLGLV